MDKINLESQRALLSFLYWAEGSKGVGVLNFANIDPQMCLIFIISLRNCYNLDESKFRIRLHLHQYHNEQEAKLF